MRRAAFMILISGCQIYSGFQETNNSSIGMESNPVIFRNIVVIENEYSKVEYNSYQDTNALNSQMPQRVEFFIQNRNMRCSFVENSACVDMRTDPYTNDNLKLQDGEVGLYDLRVLYPEDCGSYFQGQCSRHSPVTIQTTFSIYNDYNLILQKRFCLKFEAASLFPKTIYRIARNERDYLFFTDMKGYEAIEINKDERCFE